MSKTWNSKYLRTENLDLPWNDPRTKVVLFNNNRNRGVRRFRSFLGISESYNPGVPGMSSRSKERMKIIYFIDKCCPQ